MTDQTRSEQPLPQVIAHRGDLTHHRENTLAAISEAVDVGIRWIECDIQLNTDLVPVLLHDPSLKRLYERDESIFSSRYPLDTLAQLLELLDQYPAVKALLEIKFESIERWGINRVLEQLQPLLRGQRQRHYVITTSVPFLRATRARGHRNIGCILRDRKPETREAMASLAPEFLVINHRRVGREPLWRGPWQWAAYEIENLEQALHWGKRGFDFVISFHCNALQQALQTYKK